MPRPKFTREQTSALTVQEYQHLQSTYSSLFQVVSLTNNVLALTTLEGDKFGIEVTAEGWKVVEGGQSSEKERTWEMVEDLLRSVSPAFKHGWDMMLLERLHVVAETQNSES